MGLDARTAAPADRGARDSALSLLSPRWRGQRDRMEVWYYTLTDPISGIGLWVHHETVAPSCAAPGGCDGGGGSLAHGASGSPYAHGWAAAFLRGHAPILERFGPVTARPGELPVADAVRIEGATLSGRAGDLSWDLAWEDTGEPMWTFPRWAWENETLPAAQIVPAPTARFRGRITAGDTTIDMAGAPGSVARIYGHGSAERWGWLHGELGGGDAIEVVSAVSRLPGLNRLPPLSFVRLRQGRREWPSNQLAAAPLLRAQLELPEWTVGGTIGRRRLRVAVTISEASAVEVAYVDPDGATATCTNSEIADAEIVLEHRRGRWEVEARWTLSGTAHAEIGRRP